MSAFLHIMVNYRNDAETEDFTRRCLNTDGADKGLFVIANNSAQGPEDVSFANLLRDHPDRVKVLNCADNPGYFPAAQRVLEWVGSKQFQFVILSNTDLEIETPDFYEKLIHLRENGTTGAVAPSVRSGLSGKESNPLYWSRPSAQKMQFLKWVYSNYFLALAYHLLSFIKGQISSGSRFEFGQEAYAPHGCFLILTQKYFLRGGNFEHGVRLYGEEIVLAEKLRALSLKVVLHPELQVFHREKGTEASLWHRWALSKRTFLFKKEAAIYLKQNFDKDDTARN